MAEKEGLISSIKFPALINFYEFTGIPKFENTQEGQILIEKVEKYDEKINKIKKNNKTILFISKILFPIIIVLSFFVLFLSSYLFYTFNTHILFIVQMFLLCCLVINFIVFIIYSIRNKKTEKKAIFVKQKPYISYLQNILNELKDKYFNDFRVFEFDNWGFLFYSKLGCSCIDLISGEMVLYAKENIKEVLLERVNLGATTVGSAYTSGDTYRNLLFNFHYMQSSDTEIDTDSINRYEWHLDILTDFLEFPKLSFKFADNTIGEDEAKIIYGILK